MFSFVAGNFFMPSSASCTSSVSEGLSSFGRTGDVASRVAEEDVAEPVRSTFGT